MTVVWPAISGNCQQEKREAVHWTPPGAERPSLISRRRLRNGLVFHAIDEYVLDLGFLVEQAALHHQQIGDLTRLDGSHPVGHAIDFGGAEGQRAHGGGFGQARVNRAFQAFRTSLAAVPPE
jgi:hypothetical protein